MSHITDALHQPVNVGDMVVIVQSGKPTYGVCTKLNKKQATFAALTQYIPSERTHMISYNFFWPYKSVINYSAHFPLKDILEALLKRIEPIEIRGMHVVIQSLRQYLKPHGVAVDNSNFSFYVSHWSHLHSDMSDEELARHLFERTLTTCSVKPSYTLKMYHL